MKKLTLFVISLLLGFSSFAQVVSAQVPDNTIVDDKNSWATLSYGLDVGNASCCVSTEYTFFNGDSIVNGLSYKKVFSCNDESHINITFEGVIARTSTKNDNVTLNLSNFPKGLYIVVNQTKS